MTIDPDRQARLRQAARTNPPPYRPSPVLELRRKAATVAGETGQGYAKWADELEAKERKEQEP